MYECIQFKKKNVPTFEKFITCDNANNNKMYIYI